MEYYSGCYTLFKYEGDHGPGIWPSFIALFADTEEAAHEMIKKQVAETEMYHGWTLATISIKTDQQWMQLRQQAENLPHEGILSIDG